MLCAKTLVAQCVDRSSPFSTLELCHLVRLEYSRSGTHSLPIRPCSPPLTRSQERKLKGHCIEFKYYADGIHSGLTPPG